LSDLTVLQFDGGFDAFRKGFALAWLLDDAVPANWLLLVLNWFVEFMP